MSEYVKKYLRKIPVIKKLFKDETKTGEDKEGDPKAQTDQAFFDELFDKYPAELRPILKPYMIYLDPDAYLNEVEKRIMAEENKKAGRPSEFHGMLTTEDMTAYVLGRGTINAIQKYWKKRYASLISADIDGIKAANYLGDLFRKISVRKKGITEPKALELFPKVEIFSLESEIEKYPEEMRTFLGQYGGYKDPVKHFADLKIRMETPEEKRDQNYKPLTKSQTEAAILAKGTIAQIDTYWAEHHPELTTKDVDGVKLANTLRNVLMNGMISRSKELKLETAKKQALEQFPLAERFPLETEIGTYPEGMRSFLRQYGGIVDIVGHFADLKNRMEMPEEKRDQNYKPLTESDMEAYTFVRGSMAEVQKYWKDHFPKITTKEINGIMVADALRNVFRKRLVYEEKMPEAKTLDHFPKLQLQAKLYA